MTTPLHRSLSARLATRPASHPVMTVLAVLLLASVLAGGVSGCAEPEGPVKPVPLSVPGDGGLPQELDDMLTGSDQACRQDKECPANVCYYGRCLGLLLVDQRFSQERIVAAIAKTMEERGNDELRRRVEMRLGAFMARQEGDVVAWQARSLLALEALKMTDTIAASLAHLNDERVKGAAAIALSRLGDSRGLLLTKALTEAEQTHVSIEAILALGSSGNKDAALPAILPSLSEDVDRMVQRAAVIALGELGDKRAIGPLVEFLEEGPRHLAHRIIGVLRSLTGAQLGSSPQRWQAWVQANDPPTPPAYEKRTVDDELDFGMPDF